MKFATSILIILSVTLQITNVALCADANYGNVRQFALGQNSSTITNQNFRNNLNSLLSTLVSESSRDFYNTTTGAGSDRVYGTYYCRGDLGPEECNPCLENIRDFIADTTKLTLFSNSLLLPDQLKCVVHYANSSTPFVYTGNSTIFSIGFGGNLTQHPEYNTPLLNSLQEIATEAGYGNWTKTNFGTKVVDVAGTQDKFHILAQCTPYITATNCSNCLNDLYTRFEPTFTRGEIVGSYCFLMFNNDEQLSSSGSDAYRNFMPSCNFHAILILLWAMYVKFM